ncbi:envelope-like protein, partial [Trifolium pratense]
SVHDESAEKDNNVDSDVFDVDNFNSWDSPKKTPAPIFKRLRSNTGNLLKVWPKQNNIFAAKVIAKYALLNKIAAANWALTTHSNKVATGLARFIYAVGARSPFDFGFYIFDETVLHGKSRAVKMHIAFPTLICDIILVQHPDICTEAGVPSKRNSNLSLDFRLFEGTHATDIATPSVKQPTCTMTRRQMIDNLKEVSKFLGEKKDMVDRVIQALELEEPAATEVEEGPSHASHIAPDDECAGGET